jgi:stage II sporulation protein D (peptidoglycan lytic transglycosylase)
VSLKIKLLAYVLFATQAACAQDVRIGVLGLFRPHEIRLKTAPGQAVIIQTKIVQGGEKSFVLERSSGRDTAEITVSGDGLTLQSGNQSLRISALHASSRGNGAADFVLAISGKISRRYRGVLEVKALAGILVPVVQMDLETAVASVVQAESAPDTPLQALQAQAVATRSYFVAARGRHRDFDFCDTTHCQFLHEPPPPESNAARATAATRALVLAYRDHAVAAMFTRSCGGRTRTPQEVGLSSHGYPYFPAACEYCLRHPSHWVRRLSRADATNIDLREHREAFRLDIDRRLGWDAVPSNNFVVHSDAESVVLDGTGEGHGIGLCQAGAKAMAQSGATFREILEHYYPNTTLVNAHLAAE